MGAVLSCILIALNQYFRSDIGIIPFLIFCSCVFLYFLHFSVVSVPLWPTIFYFLVLYRYHVRMITFPVSCSCVFLYFLHFSVVSVPLWPTIFYFLSDSGIITKFVFWSVNQQLPITICISMRTLFLSFCGIASVLTMAFAFPGDEVLEFSYPE